MPPSSEQLAFWSAIRANPLDDTPRLVYADWLQENGDEARAEFIRVQCALALLGPDRRKGRKQRPALEAREKQLLARHRKTWGKRFCQEFRRLGVSFARGFVNPNALSLEEASRVVKAGDGLEPFDQLRVRQGLRERYNHKRVVQIASWPGAGCITLFNLHGGGPGIVDTIIRPGSIKSLVSLILYRCAITEEAVRLLAAWPHASQLRVLNLTNNLIDDVGAYVLAGSPFLTNVSRLDITRNPMTNVGWLGLRKKFKSALQTRVWRP